ncbi:MAG TPA: histidine ammonia-lyase, partial [Acidimicrobiia bacterium]|nr:histidine ammonia-lyase [Acidimicrobiia bacterium]
MIEIIVDGSPLTPGQVVEVARGRARARPGASLGDRMDPARAFVDAVTESGEVVYGITTGFGALASTHIGREEAEALQLNLIRSHASGVGDPLPDELVRAILLLRARSLAQGHSGVRPIIVERLLEMLERDILPVIPAQGSVGASGDLAPFAHMALPVIGEGLVKVDGRVVPAAETDLEPIVLRAKEGLSLLNGTEGMAAMGALGLDEARTLVIATDVACALTVEAMMGSARPFREDIHRLRPHPGQIASAHRIAGLLEGSAIGAGHADDFDHAVQDAYSLRCAPQVHGAVSDTLDHMEDVLTREMGSVVDNPIVFPETGEVVSGGNFHGQPLAFVLDFATIAVSELASISERRTDRLLDPARSRGLPAFLAPNPGLHSGYMIGQYVQAALVAENKVLSHPASVDTIPTSAHREDHVSMSMGAALKAARAADFAVTIVAVELLAACQALDL